MDRFVEWTAGLATVRRGLSEGELLEMTEACFGPAEFSERWDVLRAWAEVGAFDPLTARTWRGRTWYARSPQIVLVRAAPSPVAALTGLAGWATRRNVERVFASYDATSVAGTTFDGRVAPPPRWVFPDALTLTRAVAALDLGPMRYLLDSTSLATALVQVRKSTVGEQPSSGEKIRTWDWARGHFSQRPATSVLGVSVEQWSRTNGPDYFLVRSADESWWTPSRNWALLIAHAAAGLYPFGASADCWVLRHVNAGMHLPLPIARALALESGIAAGPCVRSDGRATYAYAAVDSRTRDALFHTLWGSTRDPAQLADVARRVRWLLDATVGVARRNDHSALEERLPLPLGLRRTLMEWHDVPGAQILANRHMPPHLLPHVRHLVRVER